MNNCFTGRKSGLDSVVTSATGSLSPISINSSDSEGSDDDIVIIDEVNRKRVSRRPISKNQNKPRKNISSQTGNRRKGRPPKTKNGNVMDYLSSSLYLFCVER